MDYLLTLLFTLLNILSYVAIISFVYFLVRNILKLQKNVARLLLQVDELQRIIRDQNANRF